MIENTRGVLAVEWLAAAQGMDLRRPLESSPQIEAARALLRSQPGRLELAGKPHSARNRDAGTAAPYGAEQPVLWISDRLIRMRRSPVAGMVRVIIGLPPPSLAISSLREQCVPVTRREDPPAWQLFRALVALSVMLNAMTAPPALASAESAMHGSHHGQGEPAEPVREPALSDDPSSPMSPDCCGGEACDCGCAGPAVVAPRAHVDLRQSAGPQPNSAKVTTFHALDAPGAPFRPPA